MSQAVEEHWKPKYREAVLELEKKELELAETEKVLKLAVNRLGLVAQEAYPQFSDDLKELQKRVRGSLDLAELKTSLQDICRQLLDSGPASSLPPAPRAEQPASPESHPGRQVAALLERLALPPELESRKARLLESLEHSLTEQELGQLLDNGAQLINDMRRQLQKEKDDLSRFLAQLTDTLADIENNFDQQHRNLQAAGRDHDAMQAAVQNQMADMESDVAEAADIDTLKTAIHARLHKIREHMSHYCDAENQRLQSTEEQVTQLQAKVQQLEQESSHLRETLRQNRKQMVHDSVTGIFNRLALDERLAQEYARWKRHRVPLSIAVLDIDHFKHINDRYGHKAGDKALRIVAQRLRGMSRETDFLARFGGEEFVLIMPDTAAEDARVAADKLRKAVAATPFHYDGSPIRLTLSAGVAELMAQDDLDSLFRRADAALYQAKDEGRNRCILAPPPQQVEVN